MNASGLRVHISVIMTLAALAAAGCGGDRSSPGEQSAGETPATSSNVSSSDSSSVSPSPSPSAGSGAGPAQSGTTALDIKEFAFVPAQAMVKVGTTVTVTNQDDATHTITSGSTDNADGLFDLKLQGGASSPLALNQAGDISYFCAIHPGMKGKLTVTA